MWFTDGEISFNNHGEEQCSPSVTCFPVKLEYAIGLDEAGRGCMAGPVAVSAVLVRVDPTEKMPFLIDDSKKLSMQDRSAKMDELCEALEFDSKTYLQECFAQNCIVIIHPDPMGRANTLNSTSSVLSDAVRSSSTEVAFSEAQNERTSSGLFSTDVSPLPRILGIGTNLQSKEVIDEINISNASLEGMAAACNNVFVAAKMANIPLNPSNTAVFLDGKVLPWTFLACCQREKIQQKKKKSPADIQRMEAKFYSELSAFPARAVVEGDQKLYSVAAASVVSKVVRDFYCQTVMHSSHPEYDFPSHKGYCTKRHRELLEQYGVSVYHRRSYKPVQKFIEENRLQSFPTKKKGEKRSRSENL